MDTALHYDTLINGGTIVTMDGERRILENGTLAISDSTIQAIYSKDNTPTNINAINKIDARGKVIIPGLINAHSHIAMTLFRGLVEDLVLQKWLERVWHYELNILDVDSVRAGTMLAFAEMIRGGVTCVHDMYWHYMATIDLAEKIGFNLISGPPITGLGDPDFDEMIATARNVLEQIKDYSFTHPVIQAQSTYTTTPEMMHKVFEFKEEYGVPFTTHASENQTELEVVRQQFGKTPIELLKSYSLLDAGTILAHCVKLDDHEIAMLGESGTHVAHCPESNLKLGSGVARIADMIAAGVNVCIGTDGATSNNDLDMLGEIRTAALLQKGVNENPELLTTMQTMEMATINGAKAFGLDHLIGSIETGKQADLAIIDFDKSHLTPCYDIYAHLIYAADKSDVDTVLINGKIHLQDGELTYLDEEAIKAEVHQIGEKFI